MNGLANTSLADSTSTPFVSIIVPTFRRPDVLRETLHALMSIDYPGDMYEIIVVDDGSGDLTPEIVAAFGNGNPKLTYYYQENRGVATARNQGARLAIGEVLIFVDDDIIVPPTLIKIHLTTLEEFGNCLVNGHWEFAPALAKSLHETPFGRYRIELEDWVKTGLGKITIREDYVEPESVTACNLGVHRKDFWHIGGFDEQFPYAGYEDQEFSIRAAHAGFRFVYNKTLQFWHNDHRLTLFQFCERQRRGATTAALLALKYPDRLAHRPLITENRSIQPGDTAHLILKKIAKRLLSNEPALWVLHRIIRILERISPRSSLLQRCYWSMCGLYIYRGIQEGFVYFERHVTIPGLSRKSAC